MSLHRGCAPGLVRAATPAARSFDVSPAVGGKTSWNLDGDGPMTLSSAGVWSITPHVGFAGEVELWGAGGGSGGHGASTATAGGTGGATTFAGLSASGGAGSLGRTNNTAGTGASGGTASGGDVNTTGSAGGSGTVGNTSSGGSGGASPNGGGTAPGTTGTNGVSTSGNPGNPSGGGASGGARGSVGGTQNQRRAVGGAGGGGYTKKIYAQGALTPGSAITLTIGSSGAAGTGDQASGRAGAPGGPAMARSYRQDVLGAGASGASELNDLTDVSISSPQAGELLRYGGGAWENRVPDFADLAMSAVALTFGAAVSWDVGAAPIAKLTLAGNCTIDASNVHEGQIAVLLLHQDATGGRSVNWGTGFSGVDPNYELGANGVSALYFGGTSSGLVMTQVLRASQAEAEAGANHSRMMTPLRTAQAIAAQAAPASHQHTLANITDAGGLAAKDTVGTTDLDDDAVTTAKLAHGPANGLLGFDASGAPAAVSAGVGVEITGGVVTAALTSVFGRTGAVAAQAGDYDGLPLNLEDAQLRRPELRDYSETAPAPAISSGTLTLDLENGNVFDVLLTQNVSAINVVNAPASGRLGTLTVRFRQDATGGRTVNLSGFQWGSAGAPAMPATAGTGRLWLMALTLDAGASWDAMSGFGAS